MNSAFIESLEDPADGGTPVAGDSLCNFYEACAGLQHVLDFFHRRTGSGSNDRKAAFCMFNNLLDLPETRCNDAVNAGEEAEVQCTA